MWCHGYFPPRHLLDNNRDYIFGKPAGTLVAKNDITVKL